MKLRTFTILSVAGLVGLTAFAGYTADQLDGAAAKMANGQVLAADCMEQGFDTPEGHVGCFTPVIAVVDANFFDPELEAGDADAAE